ncbi:MAG TPA: cupin domain-containing protein [Pseudonocardiaceae bacterium]
MYVPVFEELVGDAETFFDRYFNKAPMLRRAALSGDPEDILSLTDLDQILSSEAIRPPYLDIAKDGRQVPPAAYTEPIVVQGQYVTDRVVPARVAAQFRAGATLTFNSLNHHRPNLRAVAAALTHRFAAQSEVIAFLTPGGKRGLAPHYDPVDVFVVQLAGTKSWRVWPVPEQRRGDDRGNLDEAALGTPAVEATLHPGDVLYMPYNCAHVATARETVSLHLSVTVQPRRWSGIVQDVVARLVTDDPTFWGNARLRADDAAAGLRAMLAMLCERLPDVDVNAETRRLVTEGSSAEGTELPHHLRDVAGADAIEPGSLLTRQDLVTVEVLDRADDKVRASIGGAVYTLPTAVIDMLDSMTDGRTVPAGALLADTSAELSTRTARTLTRIGVLRPA